MRVTPRDANYIGPGSRFCILRPELITAFCQAKATERSKTKSTSQGDAHIASNSPNVDGEIQINGFRLPTKVLGLGDIEGKG
ncbi:clustered mitochondria protein-like [Ziziphus jujuba]|uniref:Clustered mitochondria protein-like n=1 Tax=Ziziphus jujuba TaxID=326968 RepID=A0ABM3ZSU2_ZIZJJ|nr:clustered mitochondria protein-like [Ziziphus jujuba]